MHYSAFVCVTPTTVITVIVVTIIIAPVDAVALWPTFIAISTTFYSQSYPLFRLIEPAAVADPLHFTPQREHHMTSATMSIQYSEQHPLLLLQILCFVLLIVITTLFF